MLVPRVLVSVHWPPQVATSFPTTLSPIHPPSMTGPHLSPNRLSSPDEICLLLHYYNVQSRQDPVPCWILFLFAIASAVMLCDSLSNGVLVSTLVLFLLHVFIRKENPLEILFLIAPCVLWAMADKLYFRLVRPANVIANLCWT